MEDVDRGLEDRIGKSEIELLTGGRCFGNRPADRFEQYEVFGSIHSRPMILVIVLGFSLWIQVPSQKALGPSWHPPQTASEKVRLDP